MKRQKISFRKDETGQRYCALMEEILARDEIILNIGQSLPPISMDAFLPNFRDIAAAEFCYLQLRMICELIAVCCLLAHGDIVESGSLSERYEADRIIKTLDKLHGRFYPRPSRQVLNISGRPAHLVEIHEGFLTKQELILLYHEAGGFLHRGSLRRIDKDTPQLSRVRTWTDKIWRLLEHHQIELIDPDFQIIGLMKDKIAARPQFSFWKRQPDGNFHFESAVRATG